MGATWKQQGAVEVLQHGRGSGEGGSKIIYENSIMKPIILYANFNEWK